ncbi:MAG: recombination protein RecR [Candidatus Magasanikbacteria bacterium]|nr:recombination protein RecR [Candidatus Magasanikbacteria bacterium]
MYPSPLENLISAFTALPGVGRRTAERFVFSLLKSGKKEVGGLILALQQLMERIKSCHSCWNFSDRSPCAICADPQRERRVVCVVAEPQTLETIEKIGAYRGVYHVLRGTARPDETESVATLKLRELLDRVRLQTEIQEVVLALNPDLHGETTMMLLEKKLHALRPGLSISRLAKGLPMGGDVQYADDITLTNALKYRTPV